MGAERGRSRAALPLPRPGAPPRPIVPDPIRFALESGLRLVVIPHPGLPQVAMRLILPAGSAADPEPYPGAASLVGALLTEGTQSFSAVALNERIDLIGASLDARVGHDFAEVDLVLLAETLSEGLDLLAEVVARPTFPLREVERTRAETLDALEAREDEPANAADDRAATEVFGPTHPYARLPLGTREGVAEVQRSTLAELHSRCYRPEGSILVVAGELEPYDFRREVDRAFAGWSGRATPIPYPPQPSEPPGGGALVAIPWPDAAQGEIRVAGLGLERRSPDWISAIVANHVLGGSTITGRLGANLREERGWTYGIRSGFSAGLQPAGWVVETAVAAEVTFDAVAEIVREIEHIIAEPVQEEELVRAKEALILSLPRAFETPARVVARFASIEVFGLEPTYWETFPDRVAGITDADVTRVARHYFDPTRLARVTVGPASASLGASPSAPDPA